VRNFIDTRGWISLLNRREHRHAEVKSFYENFRVKGGILYTTNDVLNETFTLIFRRLPIQQAVASIEKIEHAIQLGYLIVEWVDETRFEKAKQLRHKFQDKPLISFTDLTSMVVISEIGISEVLTEDDHFLQVGMGLKKVP